GAYAAVQGAWRDECRAALGYHDESRAPYPETGNHRECGRCRYHLHHADGRRGGAAPRVHRGKRHLREYRRVMTTKRREMKSTRVITMAGACPCRDGG